jgi:hypothetical protein
MRSLVVRKFAPDEWPLYRMLRLAALEESPDAFGSTLAHEAPRADDDWATRLARGANSARELPLVAELDNEPSGLAWVRLTDDEQPKAAHLYQLNFRRYAATPLDARAVRPAGRRCDTH